MQSTTRHGKMLKVHELTSTEPKKRRFNYDLGEAIKDSMRKTGGITNLRELSKSQARNDNNSLLGDARSTRSRGSAISNRSKVSTLKKSEL